jgi:NADH:ubiquinone oxidoreductase subunit 3 (subunit A)
MMSSIHSFWNSFIRSNKQHPFDHHINELLLILFIKFDLILIVLFFWNRYFISIVFFLYFVSFSHFVIFVILCIVLWTCSIGWSNTK